jgi:hypothetical protein
MPAELGLCADGAGYFPVVLSFVTCSYESRWSGPPPTFCSPYTFWLAVDYFE